MGRLVSLHRGRTIIILSIVLIPLCFLLTFHAQIFAAAGINRQINFQGKLVNADGTNVTDGNYTVVFKLYEEASGGTALWTETQTVSVTGGIFRVSLGSVTAIPSNFNFNWDGIYLGVKVGSDSEMTPRIQMTAVPYAFNAEKVAGLTVQDENGASSTSGTLKIPNAKTVSFNGAFTFADTGGLTFQGSDNTGSTITFHTGTHTLVDQDTVETLTSKTIGSTGLTFSGATADLLSTSNNNITITPNGSGDTILSSTYQQGVKIGTSSNIKATLSVAGGIGSNALAILNQTNGADILAASASGSTKFRITNDGTASSSAGFTIDGAGNISSTRGQTLTLGGLGTGDINLSVAAGNKLRINGTAGSTLTSGNSCISDIVNGIVTGTIACAASNGGNSLWQINSGVLSPGNQTVDFTLGGTATTGAKFAFSLGGTNSTVIANGTTSNAALTAINNGVGDLFTASQGATPKFVIDHNGNVGIGTSVPGSSLLAVGSTSQFTVSNTGAVVAVGVNSGAGLLQGSLGLTITGAGVSLNDSSNNTVSLAGGTSTGQITLGGTGTQTIDIGDGAGVKTVGLGSSNSTSTTTILGGSGNVNIGNTQGNGNLVVAPNAGGNAALIVNKQLNTSNNDLFTASSSGTTKFVIKSDGTASSSAGFTIDGSGNLQTTKNQTLTIGGNSTGNITIAPNNGATGGILNITAASGLAFSGSVGSLNQCLLSGGTGSAASWGACDTSAGVNLWNQASGVLSPKNSTVDLLIGGTSTTSAAFAFTGVDSTSPIASFSAVANAAPQNGNGNGLVLDTSNSTIQSLLNRTLVLGGTTTGNIQFKPGNSASSIYLTSGGNVGIGTTVPTQALTVGSTGQFTVTSGGNLSTSGTIATSGTSSITSGGAFVGPTSSNTINSLIINAGALSGITTINMSGILTNTANGTALSLTGTSPVITTASNNDLTLTPNGSGNIILTGDSDSQVLIGATSATTEFPLFVNSGIGSNAALAVNNINNGDLFTASASGTTKFRILNDGTASSSAGFTIDAGGNIQTTKDQTLTLGGNSTGNIVLSPLNNAGLVLIGGVSLSTAEFSLNTSNSNFTLGVAGTSNGQITFNSSGTNISSPTIAVDSNGNLTIQTAQANTAVNLGSGAGNINLSLSRAADLLSATKVVTLSSGYSSSDFTFQRTFTGGSNAQGGDLLFLEDTSGGSGTINPDLLSIDSSLTSGTFTGNFIHITKGGIGELFRITSSGNVGIGPNATSPTGLLYVSGTTTGNAAAIIDQRTATGDLFTASASGATKFVIDNGGNVGIGTANPLTRFNVVGPVNTSSIPGSWTPTAIFDNAATSTQVPIEFRVAGTYRAGVRTDNFGNMVVDQTGSLYLSFDSGSGVIFGSGAGGGVAGVNTSGHATFGSGSDLAGSTYALYTSAAPSSFNGDNTNSAYFMSGNVGIGTTSPTAKLNVEGGNVEIGAQTNSVTTLASIMNKQGQFASGGTSLIASSSAMAVYNGSLYVGTGRGNTTTTGGAEVYRYNGGGAGSWTVINTTAGRLNTTTTIASISAMAVWNGNLYVGTSGKGTAEVYRYNGGTGTSVFTLVSQSTAGTIAPGGTSAIDGVVSMAVYNGSLYIGTKKLAGQGEVYRYNGNNSWTSVVSAAGTLTGTAGIDAVPSLVVYNNKLYAGTSKNSAAEVYSYTGGTTWVKLSTGTGTIGTGGASNVSSVSTMAVYNGKLYVGTYSGLASGAGNNAEIWRYDDTTNAAANWTLVMNAAGKLKNGGTASIDGIGSLVVYNGHLYAGTNEPNGTELYQYNDNDVTSWILISTTTKGTLASTANIDRISAMIPYNGTLYVGTSEDGPTGSTGTEVYTYTSTIDQSYALQFHASSLATSEQNSLQNLGSIWFEASPSAQVNNGVNSTGSFMFSHGLITGAGAYDVAEDYGTRDSSLEAGDVISIDSQESGLVKKTTKAYDSSVVGVYSANPGFRLSQIDPTINGASVVPVALVGRVPVKVSTENGEIKPGDYLTSSSTPGVAMKATKAGAVIGKAMEGFNCQLSVFGSQLPDSGQSVNQSAGNKACQGQITVYVTESTYNGQGIDAMLPDGLTDSATKTISSDLQLLSNLTTTASTQSATSVSEISTDRLIAGLEVITPKVVTNTILTNEIKVSTGTDISLQLTHEGKFIVKDETGKPAITFDSEGNASFSGQLSASSVRLGDAVIGGTLTVNKIKAQEIDGLSFMIGDQIASLSAVMLNSIQHPQGLSETNNSLQSNSAGSSLQLDPKQLLNHEDTAIATIAATTNSSILGASTSAILGSQDTVDIKELFAQRVNVSLDATVLGTLEAEGGLSVFGPATFSGTTIFEKLVGFFDAVVFKGAVSFDQAPTFSADTAGVAVIKKGSDRVDVAFTTEYKTVPNINASISFDQITPEDTSTQSADQARQKELDLEQNVLSQGYSYIIVKRSTKGFTILLNKKAADDVYFSWNALASHDTSTTDDNQDPLFISSQSSPGAMSSPAPTIQPLRKEVSN